MYNISNNNKYILCTYHHIKKKTKARIHLYDINEPHDFINHFIMNKDIWDNLDKDIYKDGNNATKIIETAQNKFERTLGGTKKKSSKNKSSKKRSPKLHKGPRGGVYIIRKGKKIYQ